MHHATQHVTAPELELGLADVLESPAEVGRLEAIVARPATNERHVLQSAQLTLEGGVEGDRWATDSYYRLKDGRSDPRCQVSLMNWRILSQIAGGGDAICLAGDNLILDFDLSESNLPAGSRLAIGDDVVLEISDLAHTGCSKFAGRYGKPARDFVNTARGKALHLRGRYASIVTSGTVQVNDIVRRLSRP